MAGETQSLRFKIEIPGKETKESGIISALTQGYVENWISTLESIDDETKKDLVELSKGYPDTALNAFVNNIDLMVARVKENRIKEQD